ncbi:hypothetical protein NDU88_010616 [Pleurodeles waltl]|uniref:Uncharacterized protein n=1 Tax=Pleurodeles waltl TaxID=8319 RepID=A0AAV7QV80_PLEWA|nr:hypothetical protein NDU88_010616 [Pleurodeles waltl]
MFAMRTDPSCFVLPEAGAASAAEMHISLAPLATGGPILYYKPWQQFTRARAAGESPLATEIHFTRVGLWRRFGCR